MNKKRIKKILDAAYLFIPLYIIIGISFFIYFTITGLILAIGCR